MEIPLFRDLTQTFNINIDELNIDKNMISIFDKLNNKFSNQEIHYYTKFPSEITMSSAQLNL